MVAYWQHVGTGEVCAVRVDDDGAIVSARGPLTPAEIGAALFAAPDLGVARRAASTPAAVETDAAPLEHGRAISLDREAEYMSLAPYRQPLTGRRDEDEDDA
jgi:hypothetical protein